MKILYIILGLACLIVTFVFVKYLNTDCDAAINQGYELPAIERVICSYKLR